MTSELESFIQATIDKTNQRFAIILRKLILEFPHETKRQRGIRGMIMLFSDQYPEEMEQHKKDMASAKDALRNPHGANYEEALRIEFKIPSTLMTRLSQTIKGIDENGPGLLTEEAENLLGERTWFRKSFPRFFVPQTY